MFDEDQVAGQHRQIETIKRAVKGQSERGLYLRGLRACRTAAMLNSERVGGAGTHVSEHYQCPGTPKSGGIASDGEALV